MGAVAAAAAVSVFIASFPSRPAPRQPTEEQAIFAPRSLTGTQRASRHHMRISENYFSELPVTGKTSGTTSRELRKQTASNGDPELDTVVFGKGSALLAQAPFILPTVKNLHILSAALSSDLTAVFREAGIPVQPAVEIQVDAGSGHIIVSANRPDANQIEDKLNSDEKLAESIRTTIAIGSHALAMRDDGANALESHEIVLKLISLHNIRYRKPLNPLHYTKSPVSRRP